MLKGITVKLYGETLASTNDLGEEIFTKTEINVNNVLVAPATNEEILDAVNLYGKKAVYTLAIPKGDTNDWLDKDVEFFGETWQTFGIPQEGIEALIPLSWNKKVMVMRHE